MQNKTPKIAKNVINFFICNSPLKNVYSLGGLFITSFVPNISPFFSNLGDPFGIRFRDVSSKCPQNVPLFFLPNSHLSPLLSVIRLGSHFLSFLHFQIL